MKKIIAKKDMRLDSFLSKHLNIARNQVENFIKVTGVLVNDKKTLGLSDVVIMAGGGAYMLENVQLPKNVVFLRKNDKEKAYEFANVRGYVL